MFLFWGLFTAGLTFRVVKKCGSAAFQNQKVKIDFIELMFQNKCFENICPI